MTYYCKECECVFEANHRPDQCPNPKCESVEIIEYGTHLENERINAQEEYNDMMRKR